MSRSVQNDYDKLRNPGFAQGGLIPKTPEGQTIKVRLSHGYFPPEVVAHYGEEFLTKLNEMKMPEEFNIAEQHEALQAEIRERPEWRGFFNALRAR